MKTFHCLKSFHSLQDQVQTLCLTYSAFHNQALVCNSSHIFFRLPCSLLPPAHAAAKAKRLAIAVWSKVRWLKPQGLCICCPHTIWLFRIYPRSWSSALHGLLSFLEGSPLCLSPFQNFRSTSTHSTVSTAICSTFFDSATRLQTPCKQKSWALFLHFLSTM